jgi:tRNA(Ile)-lysidine synthase
LLIKIMIEAVHQYIQRHRLIQAGDRAAVAASGGADSVALLLALITLRSELGIVLSVAHFNHQIRGDESDADQQFVAELARTHGLEFFTASGDAPGRSLEQKESLETAARELRYRFFRELMAGGKVNKVALAHTMDDQAETVLMRLLRGAGTRGLAGIYPERNETAGTYIRPLLETSRAQVEAFLLSRKQAWREDATNKDAAHTRNKVRHELIPRLREFNPAVVETLARSADVARAEEEYWREEAERLLPLTMLPGSPVRGGGRAVATSKSQQDFGLDIEALASHPLALRRRIIRAAGESAGIELDLEPVEQALRVAAGEVTSTELAGGWRVLRSHRELRFEQSPAANKASANGYDLPAPIPGQVAIPDVNLFVRLHLMPLTKEEASYNLEAPHATEIFCAEAGRLKRLAEAGSLRVRNWREGDRFRQAHASGEKKVKDLLQDLKVPKDLRRSWPVVSSGGRVIWVWGARPLSLWFTDEDGTLHRLLIEAQETGT